MFSTAKRWESDPPLTPLHSSRASGRTPTATRTSTATRSVSRGASLTGAPPSASAVARVSTLTRASSDPTPDTHDDSFIGAEKENELQQMFRSQTQELKRALAMITDERQRRATLESQQSQLLKDKTSLLSSNAQLKSQVKELQSSLNLVSIELEREKSLAERERRLAGASHRKTLAASQPAADVPDDIAALKQQNAALTAKANHAGQQVLLLKQQLEIAKAEAHDRRRAEMAENVINSQSKMQELKAEVERLSSVNEALCQEMHDKTEQITAMEKKLREVRLDWKGKEMFMFCVFYA